MKSISPSSKQVPFRPTTCWAKLSLLVLLVALFPGSSLAQSTKTIGEQFAILKNVPGLSKLPVKNIKLTDNANSADITLRGKSASVYGFKVSGTNMAAVVIQKLKLTDLVPIPKGTPIDGVSLKDMALIYVPKGHAKKNIPTHSFPSDVRTALSHSGTSISLKEGINLFGQGNISSSDSIKKVLKLVGFDSYTLPLSGVFPRDLFKHDLKKASQKLKNQILTSLNLSLPLPKDIKIPGMPKIVSVSSAKLIVVGREVKGKHDIFAGVTGEFDITVGSKSEAFSFGILAGKPGKKLKAEITGSSKEKIHLPFFQPLDLTKLDLVANKSGGKWDVVINGKATLKGKTVDVAIHHDPKKGNSAEVTGKIKLADLLPGNVSIPGVTDVEFDQMNISKDFLEVKGKIKKLDTTIAVFKHSGKTYIAINNPDPLKFSNLVSQAKGTPIDAVSLNHMNYIWAPKGGAVKGMALSVLPSDIADQVKHVVNKVNLKEGLNVIGSMVIKKNSGLGKLLTTVKAYKSPLPLVGKLSPKIFKSGSSAAIKNEILDNLDITVPLPELKLPGLPKAVDIKHTVLSIKGVNDKGKRSISVDVAGELDFTHGSSKADFNFDVKLKKKKGQNKVQITAKEVPGTKFTIDMVKKFELSNMDFSMDNFEAGGWAVRLAADSKIKNTSVHITYVKEPKKPNYVEVDAKGLTLAKLIDSPDLPGIDDVELDSIIFHPGHMLLHGAFKGQEGYLYVQKSPYGKGHYIAAYMYDMNLASLIPGSSGTPLNDVDFKNVVLFHSPMKSPVTWGNMHITGDAGPWIEQSNANPTIKPGMNVFGHMDIKPSGELGKLLKAVGVTELKLPLGGGFSPKAFAKNISAQAIKNSILDHLDIKVNLPKLEIPGVGDYLTLSKEHLEIKGKLPDGSRGLSVKVASDAKIKIKNEEFSFFIEVDYDRSPGAAVTDLEVKGHTDKPWNKPFGISYLNLEELKLDIRKRKADDGTRSYDIDLAAKTDIGSHSKLDVKVDVHEKDGKITDAYFELDGPLKLSDIPEIKKIPHADKFTLTKLIISEHGVEADTKLGKHQTDLYAFYHDSSWNAALTQTDFNLGEVIPTPGDLLKEIKFPFAAVMLSEKGLNTPFSDLSKVGQDALKDIFSDPKGEINIKPGLAFVAGFHPKNSGKLGKHLKGMGVHSGMVVMGEVGGFFGGTPSLTLEGILSSAGASNLPSFLSFIKNEHLDFYITATEEEFDIGLDVGLTVEIKKDTLTFDTKVAVKDVDEGELGIGVTGGMEGIWHKPFGIPGFSFGNVLIDVTLDDAGAKLGFTGTTNIAGEKISIATDIQLSEALVPDAGAFKGSVSEVDMFFIEEVATGVIGKAFKLDIPQGIFPKFKNVSLAFVSPGGVDAAIGLNGTGFGLAGDMSWLGHDNLAAMKLSISPTSGIHAKGKILPIKLGLLDLEKNYFTMDVGITEPVPSLKLSSYIKIEYLKLEETFDIVFNKNGAKFDATAKITDDLSLTTEFLLSGIDLTVTKPGFKDADFSMEGDLKLDIGKFVGAPIQTVLDDIFGDLDAGFKKAEAALTTAQAKVDKLTGKINAEREVVRKERQKAEKKVEDAQKRVDSLNKDITGDWKSYHHCHGFFTKWPCRAKYGIEIAVLKAVVAIADEALKLVESLIDHFPLDLDPRVGILIAERDVADAALAIVKAAVEGADVIAKVEKVATDKITTALKDSVNIKQASFAGDFRAIISGAPVILSLDAEVFGGEIKQTLPFKIQDIPYDVEKMGIVGAKGLWHLIDKVVGDIVPGALKHKLRAHITDSVNSKADAIKVDLKKYGTDYAQYASTKDTVATAIAAQSEDYMKKEHYASVLAHNPLDHRSAETFSNELIEAGHTGLCLDNVSGQVKQEKCADGSSSRWSVVAAANDSKGYQNFVVAGTTKCIAPEGIWKTVTKKYTSPKFGNTESFSFKTNEFSGDGKLTIQDCKDSEEFKWKTLPHGTDGWILIANKATEQCLHFTNSSALPGQATAEWQPCVGSANQVFRVADKATPKYYPNYIALRNDQLGLCLGEAGKDTTVPMATCDKAAYYDYMVDIRGFAKFINVKTGHCLQPSGYAVGAKLTEVACTQLDYQWWDASPQAGGIIIKNAQTNLCTNPPFSLSEVPPTQVACTARNNAVFAPVAAKYRFTGPTWEFASSDRPLPPKSKRYETKTGQNLCAFEYDGSFVPGLIVGHNGLYHCGTAFSDSATPDAYSTGKFRLMMSAPDITWRPNTSKKLEKYNIPTGGFGGASEANIYTCRTRKRNVTLVHGGQDRSSISVTFPSAVGWTADGKTCHVFSFVAAAGKHPQTPATDFDILSRWDKAFYQLQGSAAETMVQPTHVPDFPLPPPVKSAPVWIIGMNYAPYAWDAKNYTWIRQKGCIKKISVDGSGVPYGIQCDDEVVKWNGTDWVRVGGLKGQDVGVGARLYAIDLNGNPRKFGGGKWDYHPTCAKSIDVNSAGTPVIIACDNSTKYLSGTSWIDMAGGKGIDIASGNETWLSGTYKSSYKWNGTGWVGHGGCHYRLDVGPDGNPWSIGCDNGVYSWDGKAWHKRPGKGYDIGMQWKKSNAPPPAPPKPLTPAEKKAAEKAEKELQKKLFKSPGF